MSTPDPRRPSPADPVGDPEVLQPPPPNLQRPDPLAPDPRREADQVPRPPLPSLGGQIREEMSTTDPRRPPPAVPVGAPEVHSPPPNLQRPDPLAPDPRREADKITSDPSLHRIAPDPLLEADQDAADPYIVRLASDPGYVADHVTAEESLGRKHNNVIKMIIAEFLALPLREPITLVEQNHSDGMQKGFLNYYAQPPMSACFTSEDENPTSFDKFRHWFMNKVDPNDVYLKKFVKMVFELNGISMDEIVVTSALPGMIPRFSFKAFVESLKSIQNHLPRVQQSVSNFEKSAADGGKVVNGFGIPASELQKLIKETLKSLEKAEKQGAHEEGESIVNSFMEKLKLIEKHELSDALRQVDKISQLADVPISVKKRLDEMRTQFNALKAFITGLTGMWSYNAMKSPELPTAPRSGNPDSATGKPAPAPAPVIRVPLIPFHKLGKEARDVLHKNYLGKVANRSEMQCLFGKQINPLFKVKATSAPAVYAVLKHESLWGSNLKGDIKIVLPFKNRLNDAGVEVPYKETCVAKLMYCHDYASLSGTVGLHPNPAVSLSGMFGPTAPVFGSTYVSGGGRLSFVSTNGSILGLEAGLSISNSEWGKVSAVASILEGKRGCKVFYDQKVLQKNTIAAELNYNHQDKTLVASAGVEHKYDSAVILKGMIRSDGFVQALVETREGIAGSRVSASVKIDLNKLGLPPGIGFSISSNPTWG